tara:strand:+ start:132 stop:647 length:516 start_codon:yes stop_codon:yes gene_type:complete
MLLIDWFSLGVILAFSVAGYFNGFAKQFFSTLAWVISILVAWSFGPLLFPFIEPYLSNPLLQSILSFLILFLLLFLFINLFGSVLTKFLNILGLRFFDKTAGLIFGSVKAIAILVTIYILGSSYLESSNWWMDSLSREWTIRIAETMEPLLIDWKTQTNILFVKDSETFFP